MASEFMRELDAIYKEAKKAKRKTKKPILTNKMIRESIMGFFSWKLSNNGQSLANIHSDRKTLKVKMIDNHGNAWYEDNYEGYGVFGGKDYYELLSEMNNGVSERGNGIELAYDLCDKCTLKPKIVSAGCKKAYDDLPDSRECPYQGYFYDF